MANNPPKTFFLPGLLAASLLLASCSAPSPLPQAAVDELEKQWQTVTTDNSPRLHVVRAWPSEVPAEQLPPSSPSMETWCVEVEPVGKDASGAPGPMIWIVTRTGPEATWFAAPLMTMSSLWPYEACGVVP